MLIWIYISTSLLIEFPKISKSGWIINLRLMGHFCHRGHHQAKPRSPAGATSWYLTQLIDGSVGGIEIWHAFKDHEREFENFTSEIYPIALGDFLRGWNTDSDMNCLRTSDPDSFEKLEFPENDSPIHAVFEIKHFMMDSVHFYMGVKIFGIM